MFSLKQTLFKYWLNWENKVSPKLIWQGCLLTQIRQWKRCSEVLDRERKVIRKYLCERIQSVQCVLLLQSTLTFFFFYYCKGCRIFIKCQRPIWNFESHSEHFTGVSWQLPLLARWLSIFFISFLLLKFLVLLMSSLPQCCMVLSCLATWGTSWTEFVQPDDLGLSSLFSLSFSSLLRHTIPTQKPVLPASLKNYVSSYRMTSGS